jgi:DNA replication protein DnaC
VGKTHLSVALADAAIRAGLAAYFITAYDLAQDLGERIAKAGWIAACAST